MKKLITILSALTLTSSTTSLAVGCNNKEEKKTSDKTNDGNKEIEVKIKPFNISEITADMIIKWVDEYKWKDYTSGKEITATPDTLGNVDSDDAITNLLRLNLESIILTKITGIAQPKKMNNVDEPDYVKMNDTDLKKITNFHFLINNEVINFNVNDKNEENSKKYIATIEITDWSKANKNDALKIATNKEKKDAKEFLDLNADAKKDVILKEHPDLISSQIKDMINEKTELSKLWQRLDFDLMKSLYDLIKGKSVSIEINLNS